jgi:hypothetical protein
MATFAHDFAGLISPFHGTAPLSQGDRDGERPLYQKKGDVPVDPSMPPPRTRAHEAGADMVRCNRGKAYGPSGRGSQ